MPEDIIKKIISNLKSRLTGFSTPFGGVNWNPPEDKRKIASDVLKFLENRRVLYEPHEHREGYEYVVRSILEIRNTLTDYLQRCLNEDNLSNSIRAMRAACRDFLDSRSSPLIHHDRSDWWISLGRMRAIFGVHIAQICAAYNIDVEPQLMSILPPPVDLSDDN